MLNADIWVGMYGMQTFGWVCVECTLLGGYVLNADFGCVHMDCKCQEA